MSDRIASDHPSVKTLRAHIKRHGPGKRLECEEAVFPADDIVRVVIDGETRFARPTSTTGITGAYGSPTFARSPGGKTEYMGEWLDAIGRKVGLSVELDVIEPDVAYGLREPGSTAIYDGIEGPKSSLADIAKQLDG